MTCDDILACRGVAALADRPHPLCRRVGAGERSDPASTPAADPVQAVCDANMPAMPLDRAAHTIIRDRLKRAGELVYARGRPDHPPFKSAGIAASQLLRVLPPDAPVVVMRDQCLRPLRELLLELGWPLVVPDKPGTCVYRLPRQVIFDAHGRRVPLRVEPLPCGSEVYVGPVAAVVCACLAFDPRRRRLYSFDGDRTAAILDAMYDRLPGGFTLGRQAPVIALAADCQQVDDWPAQALAFHTADVVVTPGRAIILGTGEVIPFRPPTPEAPHDH